VIEQQIAAPLLDHPEQLDLFGLAPAAARSEKATDAYWVPALPPLPAMEGEQSVAVALLERFLTGDRQYFVLHGLAGTGKTTVLAALAQRLRGTSLLAPTGKAAAVLARKTGLPTNTLHRLLYMPETDEQGNLIGFRPKFEPGRFAGMIALVDEASMIGTELATDLLASGIRIIASGDPGQLPPVEQQPYFSQTSRCTRYAARQPAARSSAKPTRCAAVIHTKATARPFASSIVA
jgi:hypothetical protein